MDLEFLVLNELIFLPIIKFYCTALCFSGTGTYFSFRPTFCFSCRQAEQNSEADRRGASDEEPGGAAQRDTRKRGLCLPGLLGHHAQPDVQHGGQN